MTPKVRIYPDRQALVAAALTAIVDRIRMAIDERESCTIALSGGSTPQPLYAALANTDLPWDRIRIFWGDERYVAPTAPDSNYGMTKRVWLDLVPIPAANIHPMPTDFDRPELAAAAYEREILADFGLAAGSIPVFDIVLLGMGDDGHTASLFPHTAALSVADRLVTAGEKDGQPRLTFTFPLLNRSRSTIFLVAGASKKIALAEIFSPQGDITAYPARGIQPEGELLWLLDAAAGAGMTVTGEIG